MTTAPSRLRQAARLTISLAFPGVLILAGYPLEIFNRNAAEFSHSPEVLTPFLLAAAGFTGLCAVIGTVLASGRPERGNAFAALGLWLGCALLLSDLVTPLKLTKAIGFDGIENVVPAPAGLVALYFVLSLATLALIWWRRNEEIARLGAVFALLVSLAVIIPSGLQFATHTRQARLSPAGSPWVSTPPPSTTRHDHPTVYHIILDGFRGSMFPAALRVAGLTEADFDGFTYFPETRSNYDGTQTSTPAFLTGTLYRQGSFRDWMSAWTNTGLFAEVKGRLGTDIEAYSHGAYHQLGGLVRGRKIEKSQALGQRRDIVLHLALTRAAPPPLRPFLYRDGAGILSPWLRSAAESGDPRLEPMRLLIEDLAAAPATPRYVFSHLYFPHGPFLVDRFGLPSRNSDLLAQSACALRLVVDLLRELKRTDRFHQSVIVIHSDHGWGDQRAARTGEAIPETVQIDSWRRPLEELDHWTSALLLVKPAGSSGRNLVTSPRLTQLLDLPNTVYELTGLTVRAPEGNPVMGVNFPAAPERHIFTGFRQWDLTANRQIWLGHDFMRGKFNHFLWTAEGLKSLPPLDVTWEP